MFNEALNNQLEMFDSVHLTVLVIFTIIIILTFVFRNKLKSERSEKIFRISMGIFLLLTEVSYHIWIITKSAYQIDMLPLTGFCATTHLITVIALLTNKTKLFDYLIYYALTGAILSLVFVDTTFTFPHFRFLHYFFVHFGFLYASLYYYFTNRVDINIKKLHLSVLVVFIHALIILVFDLLLKRNWFYLIANPLKEISDALGLPWYTILWLLTIFALTYGWYGLLKLGKKLCIARESKS